MSISLDMHYIFKFSTNPYLAVALLLLNNWHIVFPGIPYHQPCLISAFSKPNNETYRCSVSRMVKAHKGTVSDRDQNRLGCSLQYTSSIRWYTVKLHSILC